MNQIFEKFTATKDRPVEFSVTVSLLVLVAAGTLLVSFIKTMN